MQISVILAVAAHRRRSLDSQQFMISSLKPAQSLIPRNAFHSQAFTHSRHDEHRVRAKALFELRHMRGSGNANEHVHEEEQKQIIARSKYRLMVTCAAHAMRRIRSET
jgi:hypothetical protein